MAPSKSKMTLRERARHYAVLRGWIREEEGSILVFGMIAFIAILMVAGLAVDMARYEHERIVLQGATDRAVLAATMMRATPNNVTPDQLVRAYMNAEGVSAMLGDDSIVVDPPYDPDAPAVEGASRTITVTPRGQFPTMFMRWAGVNDLMLATPAQAVESLGRPPAIEVVMVLDVSGSMGTVDRNAGGRSRMELLRSAATTMVRDLLDDTEPGDVGVSLVPYSQWVNLPTGMITRFNTLPSGSQRCIDFNNWTTITNSFNASVRRYSCNVTPTWMEPLIFQHDATTINARINSYTPTNTTMIDLAIRHGALFFDPAIRPYIESQIEVGRVHAAFRGRPHDWDGRGVIRAMVVMTDGDNCCDGGRFTHASQQDTNARETCQAIRNEGILIYTIAYGASTGGRNLMRDCASSELHFFETSGTGIADVFQAIRNNIERQALRLTL